MKRYYLLYFISLLTLFGQDGNNTLNFPDELSSNYSLEDYLGGMNFDNIVAITSPPDSHSLYVVEKAGKIFYISDIENPTKQLFLDYTSIVSNEGESGLIGLAFHPNFKNNDTFYIFYGNPKTANYRNQYMTLSKCVIENTSTDLDVPYDFTETVLIHQKDDKYNHNGGDLHFGKDGYLYVSLGDEGAQNDKRGNGQRIDRDFFSAIMRLDVDRKAENLEPNPHDSIILDASGNANYKIPYDNPWVGATSFNNIEIDPDDVRTEFYAVGFRNPWRMSFDPEGNLWIGDVGQSSFEDLDFIPYQQAGMNFGWPAKEGFIDGPKPIAGIDFDDPIYAYGHGNGEFEGGAIIGGVFYTGDQIPTLKNSYIFGDNKSKRLWTLKRLIDGVDVKEIVLSSNIPSVSSFGLDPITGEVLVAHYANQGKIYKLTESVSNENEIPQTLADTGAFSDLTTLTPQSGIHAYEPNVTFWSDYALKSRWFSLPDHTQRIGFRPNEPWTFPSGMVWVKHFDLEMQRGNPESAVRVETRFLIKTDGGAYGLSYRWNEEGTNATLVPAEGEDIEYQIEIDGQLQSKTWSIPNRNECMVCHTDSAGLALSFNTQQLNKNEDIFGAYQNILTGLYHENYLDVDPGDPSELPKVFSADDTTATLDQRARSYLEVNCAYCHQENGPTPAEIDLRSFLAIDETNLINIEAIANGDDPENRLVLPGDHTKSVLFKRISASDNFTRMPPLATTELDHEGMALIQEWITELGSTTEPEDQRNVKISIDPYTGQGIFQLKVENNSDTAALESMTITVMGNAYFDKFEKGSKFQITPNLGRNNDGVNSDTVTLLFDNGNGLLAGESDQNRNVRNKSDIDGKYNGFEIHIKFTDGHELSGLMEDISDSDDGNSEYWELILNSHQSVNLNKVYQTQTDDAIRNGGGCLLK